MKRPFPIVEVRWEDSFVNSRWMSREQGERVMTDPVVCLSVGYFVKKTKKELVLASSTSDVGDHGSWHSIPLPMVRKITRIKGLD